MNAATDIRVETITPATALKLLARNTFNRTIRSSVVQAYAADMRAGKWHFNGDPIRLAKDGTLLDGQHRLHAIAESGVPIQMVIMRGLAAQQQHTMDTGIKRNLADTLKLREEKYPSVLAGLLRSVALADRLGLSNSKVAFTTSQREDDRGDYSSSYDGQLRGHQASACCCPGCACEGSSAESEGRGAEPGGSRRAPGCCRRGDGCRCADSRDRGRNGGQPVPRVSDARRPLDQTLIAIAIDNSAHGAIVGPIGSSSETGLNRQVSPGLATITPERNDMPHGTDPCLDAGSETITELVTLNPKQVAELEGRGFARGYAEAMAAAANLLRTFHQDMTTVKRPDYRFKTTQDFIAKFESFAAISREAVA